MDAVAIGIMANGNTTGYSETADIETASDGYAARFGGASGAWMLGVQEGIALDMLRRHAIGSVLDVGGGHGQLAVPLARAGMTVTVLGSDESCRRRIEPEVRAGSIAFRTGNVIDLPFEDQSFEAVVSVRLLPHCEAWEPLLAGMCRVARRLVLVDYPTPQSLNAIAPLFFGAKKKMEGNTRTWRAFRHEEVRGAFERNGFAVVERRGQFFWPMALHRLLKMPFLSKTLEGAAGLPGLRKRWGSPVLLSAVRALHEPP